MGYKTVSNKRTNKTDRQTDRQILTDTTVWWLPDGAWGRGEMEEGKGLKQTAMEEDLTLGGEHTIESAEHMRG